MNPYLSFEQKLHLANLPLLPSRTKESFNSSCILYLIDCLQKGVLQLGESECISKLCRELCKIKQSLSYSKIEQDTLLHESFQRLYLSLSTESPLRLISHKYTFQRKTQIRRNLRIELINDSSPSHPFLLCKETAQGKCSINLDVTSSELSDKVPLSSKRNTF